MIYSNSIWKFAEKNNRSKVFTIKSDLAHEFDKDEFLYIPINLGRAITRIFKDYVIGMGFSVDFNNEDWNKKFVEFADKIHLQIILDSAIETQSAIWYSILRVRKVDDMPRIELIPLPNYCANIEWLQIGDTFQDIKEHFIFSIQKDEQWKKYLYVDRYEKQPNWEWIGYFWEKWNYNRDFVFTDRIEEWEEEVLKDWLPLFIFNNDLDNPHAVDEEFDTRLHTKDYVWDLPRYFNQSDYRDLADLFQEVNDRSSQISIEFIKNLTSKLSVPAWFKDWLNAQALRKNNQDRKFAENVDFIVHNPWEEPAKYIEKDATYVQTSINDYMPYLLKLIWFISTIPTSLLANAIYGANNPVGTTEKEFQPFYARIEAKQQRIYSELQRMFKLLMTYIWIQAELPTIRFKKPASYDISERTNTAIAQMNAWIMSKSSAIAYTMWYDETEIKEELAKIDKEVAEAYKRDWSYLDLSEENEEEEKNLDNNEKE